VRYAGEWNQGKWEGEGYSYDEDGIIIYKGGDSLPLIIY
jgi:hypothetical protein